MILYSRFAPVVLATSVALHASQTWAAERVAASNARDILVVVDNSSSMVGYQERIADAIPAFLAQLIDVDWQIAVVTTDNSCLRAKVVRDDANALVALQNAILAGTNGRSIERGVFFSVQGLKGYCATSEQPWRRENASPSVVLFSDEENCGSTSNEDCIGQPGESIEYFIDNTPPGTRFSALIYDQYDKACTFQAWKDPLQYRELITRTSGERGLICNVDYRDFFTRLADNIKGD